MKLKTFVQFSYREDCYGINIVLKVSEKGAFYSKGAVQYVFPRRNESKEAHMKSHLRKMDREWVYRNIPSSIHWHTEIHHNWYENGTMYLLTKGEHILRHRSEKG
jgi:hypothetical protein